MELPKIIYLYGAARAAETRMLRKTSGLAGGSQARVGPNGRYVVRPGQRVALRLDEVLAYMGQIKPLVDAGYLLLEDHEQTRLPISAFVEAISPQADTKPEPTPEPPPAPPPAPEPEPTVDDVVFDEQPVETEPAPAEVEPEPMPESEPEVVTEDRAPEHHESKKSKKSKR